MPALSPGIALLPLRLFLGGTFVYAGVQKLSDSGFLHPGAPTYIGTQLQGFADGTPGGFILTTFALPHPVLAGVGVAIVEISIGLLTAAGLLTRAAAAGGLALSLLLFLTASWHTTPYFLEPDLVFAFTWLPFVLTGANGQPALDHAVKRPSPELVRRTTFGLDVATSTHHPSTLTRRALIAELGALALGIAGVAALLKGSYRAPAAIAGAPKGAAGSGDGATSAAGSSPGAGSSSQTPPANAVKLGASSRLPVQQGATYSDPADGQPDIVIRQADGSLLAYSAVCTHAGCTVGYQGGVIACPCHGATFDPRSGEVTGGPAPRGLAPKTVVEHGGEIYAVPG